MSPRHSSRDWTEARVKVEEEGCRVGPHGCWGPVDAAHIVPRSRVRPGPGEDPKNIVPLCRRHHEAFDGGQLDILPYLSPVECSMAVLLFDGDLPLCLRRLTGVGWVPAAA